jgi:carbon catabolite-derepressing protein kinase
VLVLELAEGGELFDYLMYSGYFDDRIARSYFRQLMLALEACHALNIFHRDIKPENILLNSHFQLKLADFGLSNYTSQPHALMKTSCGTVTYMPPELVQLQV